MKFLIAALILFTAFPSFAQNPASSGGPAKIHVQVKGPVLEPLPKAPGKKCYGDRLHYTFAVQASGVSGAAEPLSVRLLMLGRAPGKGSTPTSPHLEERKLREIKKEFAQGATSVEIEAPPIMSWKCSCCRSGNDKYEAFYAELLQGTRVLATDQSFGAAPKLQKLIAEEATKSQR